MAIRHGARRRLGAMDRPGRRGDKVPTCRLDAVAGGEYRWLRNAYAWRCIAATDAKGQAACLSTTEVGMNMGHGPNSAVRAQVEVSFLSRRITEMIDRGRGFAAIGLHARWYMYGIREEWYAKECDENIVSMLPTSGIGRDMRHDLTSRNYRTLCEEMLEMTRHGGYIP